MVKPMPAIFFGHGNPMNALSKNVYTDGWVSIGKSILRPKAVLCVSAHWYLPATLVTAMPSPRTIHDFGGFPRELYEVKYPAPGKPDLANRVRACLRQSLLTATSDGVSTTELGPYFATYSLMPMFRSCS